MTKKHKTKVSKHLLDNKRDVDEKVEKILKMIGVENESDDSGHSFEKSKLSSLVKSFHEEYQDLHNHYKQLISKLGKVGNSSASSDSSDSDSEGNKLETDVPKPKKDSLKKENGWKEKLVEDYQGEDPGEVARLSLEAEVEKLKQNAIEQSEEMADLKHLLDDAIEDKDATRVELSSEAAILSSENENLKSLVEAAESEARDLLKKLTFMENEIRTLSSEKQIVENERDDLKISLVYMENKGDVLRNELKDAEEKCNILAAQLEKAQLTEKEVQVLLAENQKMKSENSNLQDEIAALQEQKNDALASTKNLESELEQQTEQMLILQQANEDLISSKANLLDEIAVRQEEKNAALLQLRQLEASINNLESELEQQLKQISVLQQANEELQEKNSTLDRQLEDARTNLQAEAAALQQEKEKTLENLQQSKASVNSLEIHLEQKRERISSLQKTNEDLQKSNSTLEKQLEETKVNLHAEILALQEEKNKAYSELLQSETSIKNLQSDLDQEKEQTTILRLSNEDLKNSNASVNKQLEQARASMLTEIAALQDGKDTALSELQQSQNSVENYERELEHLKEKIFTLQQTNIDLHKNHGSLSEQFEEVKAELQRDVLVTQEQKNTALSQLKLSEASVENLERELEQQREQLSILHVAYEDLKKSNAYLDKQLEEARASLHAEIVALQEEKDRALSELQQSQASVKNFERDLEQKMEKILILRQANDDLEKNNCSLTEQFEEEKAKLQRDLLVTQEEKGAALKHLKQSEASVENLESELEQQREQLSILHVANEDLKKSNAYLDKQLEEARASLHAEIVALQEEKGRALSELQHSQASVKNFERDLEQKMEKILILQQANDGLEKNNCSLTEQFEEEKAKLQRDLLVTQEEKGAALSHLKQSEASVENLESELEQLRKEVSIERENSSSLDRQLEEARLEVSDLQDKLEKVQTEMANQIIDVNMNANNLEKTIDLLSSQKSKVEENLKIMIDKCMDNLVFLKEFEDRVEQKVANQESELVCLHQSLRGIFSSWKQLQHAYDEASTKASQLEILGRNQGEQIEQLEEKNTAFLDKHRLLEAENMYADRENLKLHKHVEELEVQLQLAKQKLKVTEAESKCKEDSNKVAMEKSQAEILLLEEQLQQFSGRISSLEEHLRQFKTNAESGVSALGNQFDELKSVFYQNFAQFVARSLRCTQELNLLRSKLSTQLDEKKELVKENGELVVRLGNEERVVSEMARRAADAEQKMVQLERTIEEKEEELAARVQEKREAIKHLSDAIVYHKNNSDDLIRYIRIHNSRRLPFCL